MGKKRYLLFAILLSTNIAYGGETNSNQVKNNNNLNYELKVGIAPFESYDASHSSERFNNGVDFGVDVYRNIGKYSLGFGGEVKRKLDSDYIDGEAGRLYAYYLIAKRELGKNYSLVGRIGRTSQKEFDSKTYGALGIEKRIGRVNVQVLAETTKLENELNDKQYNTVGVKIGYIFGGEGITNNNVASLIEEESPTIIAPTIEPVVEPIVESVVEIVDGYDPYITEVPKNMGEYVREITDNLNKSDVSGILEMKAYSDNSGSKELNVNLANERMDNLENEFQSNNLSDKIKIIKINPEETVKKLYRSENDTLENRKFNRRIEVNFIEE